MVRDVYKRQPNEYGFYSNVNPNVDHPRWSQKTERRIGLPFYAQRRTTLMFNGYTDQVASLYTVSYTHLSSISQISPGNSAPRPISRFAKPLSIASSRASRFIIFCSPHPRCAR